MTAVSAITNAPDSANPGKVVNISGARLSFDQEDPDCGVFFWNGGGRETAVRATTYTRIGTARIDVEVPDTLLPGEYNLEVRSRPTKRDVRFGIYDKKVKVETPRKESLYQVKITRPSVRA